MDQENLLNKYFPYGMLALLIALYAVFHFNFKDKPNPNKTGAVSTTFQNEKLIGTDAPETRFQMFDESVFNLSAELGKNNVILYFFSMRSPMIQKDIEALNEFYEEYKNSNLKLIGVNIDGNEEYLTKFILQYGVRFPLAMLSQKDKDLAEAYNLRTIPTTVFIDKSGKIEFYETGPMDRPKLLFSKYLF